MMNKKIFTPIPTCLLRGFLDEKKRREVINDIFDYAIYYHAERIGGDYHRAHQILEIKSGEEKLHYNNGKNIASKVSSKSFYELHVQSLVQIRDNSHTQKYLENFLMYHALRSMQGKKSYYLASNLLLASRMDGNDGKVKDKNELSSEVKMICTRRRMETKREELKKQYGVEFYYPKGVHGFYYSTIITFDDLVKSVFMRYRKKGKKNSIAELSRQKEAEILEKISKNEKNDISNNDI